MLLSFIIVAIKFFFLVQMSEIMDKELPEAWKQLISHKIENNLFSKVIDNLLESVGDQWVLWAIRKRIKKHVLISMLYSNPISA